MQILIGLLYSFKWDDAIINWFTPNNTTRKEHYISALNYTLQVRTQVFVSGEETQIKKSYL